MSYINLTSEFDYDLDKCEYCKLIKPYLYFCAKCNKLFCQKCVDKCTKCNKRICFKCDTDMNECERCGNTVCDKCGNFCEKCYANYCRICKGYHNSLY